MHDGQVREDEEVDIERSGQSDDKFPEQLISLQSFEKHHLQTAHLGFRI